MCLSKVAERLGWLMSGTEKVEKEKYSWDRMAEAIEELAAGPLQNDQK